jgi:hypothetical protein
MRGQKSFKRESFKRGRWVSLLIAGGIGYLLGGWHAVMLQSNGLSPAQTVALRFPEEPPATHSAADAAPVGAARNVAMTVATTNAADANVPNAGNANVLGNPQLALLSPAPMVPAAARTEVPDAPQPATEEAAVSPPPTPPVNPVAPREKAEARTMVHHRADHAGFVLNDAQIASIKTRLHLTPDQERMWPAVEAALRNIAYERARDARRRGAPVGVSDVASLDPNAEAVQDLKSAAIPLIMSFNDEQKNEVRSLAHVMGLDRLASEM